MPYKLETADRQICKDSKMHFQVFQVLKTADPLVLPFDFSKRSVNLQQVFRPAVLSQLFKGEKECEHLPIPAFPR